jgi:glycosyltransferase involved in cell wall biosynthesis
MARMELKLLGRIDDAIAVSTTLQERLAHLGRQAGLLTHGVDLEFWRAAESRSGTRLDAHERPVVLFFGLIDRRLDLAFLRRLGESLSQGTILLVGPRDQPEAGLANLPRVTLRPALPFEELPALAQQADVLIMPYADLPVTRAMQPLKLKEYLAAGKPVVVRDLPANREWSDCLDLCATAVEFATAVRTRLETGLPDGQRRARQRLEAESWAAKALRFSEFIHGRS